jgi:hypothetical protein
MESPSLFNKPFNSLITMANYSFPKTIKKSNNSQLYHLNTLLPSSSKNKTIIIFNIYNNQPTYKEYKKS